MVTDILIIEALSLAVAAVAMTVTAVVARRAERVSVVDVTWGLALAAVAAVDAVRSAWPSWVLFGLVAAWGFRLSGHIARRSRGHGEDPRYVVMLGGTLREVGMVIEAVADAQLAAYKAEPNRPAVLDRGLWAWTRHPNYFGDALFWIGIWVAGGLAAEGTWIPAAATLAAPIAMTLFLWFITGARLLEKTMIERPGYRAYADRTPMFVPRPPTWGRRL
jgi:steroid 5-alpha reductase family enzyme